MRSASEALLTAAAAPPRSPVQPGMLSLAAVVIIAITATLATGHPPRLALLFLVGVLLGVSLYHAHFGFTGAYRRLFLYRDGTDVRAQIVMLAVAMVLFAPVLASGSAFGRNVVGAIAPLGVQVAVGAFVFGIGMQLGGGCSSGTLQAVGGGRVRMLVTLVAMCAGSFLASLHMGWWQQLPSFQPIALGSTLGWPSAIALQLAFLLALAVVLRAYTRSGAPPSRPAGVAGSGLRALLTGPWPLLAGALALAVLNLATLLLAGHPWTITWGLTLWGAKAASALGWDPASSTFWAGGFPAAALRGGILGDVTSVMNIGLVLGAFSAAAAAGRFAPRSGIPIRSLAAALIGGLAMGYGARIAFGCNIGAFFSGVASTSLHGWLWIAAALPGNYLGVRLRPHFGLRD